MKMFTIALNTFGGFLRNKLMILFLALFVSVVLLMLTPMLGLKAMANGPNAAQVQGIVMTYVGAIMYFVTGCGSLLAIWASADSVAGEMKSGTILAVMARPVKRWEFLAGKYLGVQMLLVCFVLMMFAMSYFLAWLGGERIQTTPWVFLVYPLVRYAVYSAISMLLVTIFHPIITFGITMLIAVLAMVLAPADSTAHKLPEWARGAIYSVLPSTQFLSEDRFYTITKASLKQLNWVAHLTTISYGLDYAFVCLLLAMWSFHRRGLTRD